MIRRDDAINLPPMKSSRDFISWRMMTHVTLLRALGEGSLISASFWAIQWTARSMGQKGSPAFAEHFARQMQGALGLIDAAI